MTNYTWKVSSHGVYHGAAIDESGRMVVWSDTAPPTQFGQQESSEWSAVSCGAYHTAAICGSGALWVWSPQHSYPTRVGNGSDWTQVRCGATHIFAVNKDSEAFVMKWDESTSSFELGDGDMRRVDWLPLWEPL